MATKTREKTIKKAPAYLEQVMFLPEEVEGRDAQTDNMDHINPLWFDNVDDGDLVAVYKFAGLRRVSKSITFTDTK
jgi:hypothetical protein